MSSSEREPAVKPFVDVSDEPVHWDLSHSLSYSQYLDLDRLLGAQRPLSYHHDEMLFIVIHQVSELWMKLCLHELNAVVACVQRDDLGPTFKMLSRVSTIQQQLLQSWDVLATITPLRLFGVPQHARAVFRDSSRRSTACSSYLIRQQERRPHRRFSAPIPEANSELLEHARSRRACTTKVLPPAEPPRARVPPQAVDRDFAQPYQASKQVAAAWLSVYHNSVKDWDLYELAERLVDLDYKFQLWRFTHMKTVERIIGGKRGTGGTGGVSYLTKALELKFFPELWTIRASM